MNAMRVGADSRAGSATGFLKPKDVDEHRLAQIHELRELAKRRSQSLAQMALAWVLRDQHMTSVLIGASKVQQIDDNVGALANLAFSEEELRQIDEIAGPKS